MVRDVVVSCDVTQRWSLVGGWSVRKFEMLFGTWEPADAWKARRGKALVVAECRLQGVIQGFGVGEATVYLHLQCKC